MRVTNLVVAYVVVAFVYTPAVRSIAQSLSNILDIWDAINNDARRPMRISLRHGIIIDCRSVVSKIPRSPPAPHSS